MRMRKTDETAKEEHDMTEQVPVPPLQGVYNRGRPTDHYARGVHDKTDW